MDPKPAGESIRLVQITTIADALHFLRGIVRLVKSKGFEVSVITSPSDFLDAFAAEESVAVLPVEMPRRIAPLDDLRALAQIRRLLRQVKPHVVHAQTPKGGLLGTTAAWLERVPARLYHIRGLPMLTATGPKRLLLRWSEKVACRLATQVLCVSHSIREAAIKEGLCPPQKIKVLFHGSGQGVDAAEKFNPERLPAETRRETRDRFAIPLDAKVIGFVGRIVRDKGIAELTGAWQVLRGAYPDLHLLIVGPFEAQDPVSPEIEQALKSDDRVHLAGRDWNTPPLYAAMDIVALPTYREGFPNVVLEAAAMCLPIVATRVPGCTDAVEEDVTGVLVPAQDSAALAQALRAYLDDAELCRRHGQAGRERALRDYRPESIWQATYEEYLAMLARAGIAVPSTSA